MKKKIFLASLLGNLKAFILFKMKKGDGRLRKRDLKVEKRRTNNTDFKIWEITNSYCSHLKDL